MEDESKLGEILKVMREVPRVYLKSRPTSFGKDVRLEVTLTATGDDADDVEARSHFGDRKPGYEKEIT